MNNKKSDSTPQKLSTAKPTTLRKPSYGAQAPQQQGKAPTSQSFQSMLLKQYTPTFASQQKPDSRQQSLAARLPAQSKGFRPLDVTWDRTITVTTFAELQTALDNALAMGSTEVLVDGTITLTNTETILVPAGATIKIKSLTDSTSEIAGDGDPRANPLIRAQSGSFLYLDHITVKDGVTTGQGGAIQSSATILNLGAETVISDNAADNGGGIAVLAGTLTVDGGIIQGNTADTDGGGVYIARGASAHFIAGQVDNNTAGRDGGGIWVDYVRQGDLAVDVGVTFSGNSAATDHEEYRDGDDDLYHSHIAANTWSGSFTQGYNNADISYVPLNAVSYDLLGAKNALGADVDPDCFKFGLYDSTGSLIATTFNSANGLITFPGLSLDTLGSFSYVIREIQPNQDDLDAGRGQCYNGEWDLSQEEFLVNVETGSDGAGNLIITSVFYNDDSPHFVNTHQSPTCGLIEFRELTFDAPGDYEYTIKELSPSGAGWETDEEEKHIIIHVVDDGYGNYVAYPEYPDGEFPTFLDVYTGTPAKYILSACKTAVGADLPEGRFTFGLYDSTGKLVSTTTNGAALETVTRYRSQMLELARKQQLACAGTVYGHVAVSNAPRKGVLRPVSKRTACCSGDVHEQAILRRLNEMQLQTKPC